ncbi:hypothetical protein [Candidatus Gillettellia adelgis]
METQQFYKVTGIFQMCKDTAEYRKSKAIKISSGFSGQRDIELNTRKLEHIYLYSVNVVCIISEH